MGLEGVGDDVDVAFSTTAVSVLGVAASAIIVAEGGANVAVAVAAVLVMTALVPFRNAIMGDATTADAEANRKTSCCWNDMDKKSVRMASVVDRGPLSGRLKFGWCILGMMS